MSTAIRLPVNAPSYSAGKANFFYDRTGAKNYADKQGKYQGQRGITLPKVER